MKLFQCDLFLLPLMLELVLIMHMECDDAAGVMASTPNNKQRRKMRKVY